MEKQTKSGRCRVSGTEVLSWRTALPCGTEGTKLEAFYREIETRVISFCERDLRQMAEDAFAACDDPKKRFHFPAFAYRLESHWIGEGDLLTVELEATLTRRGRSDPLRQQTRRQIWSMAEDCLLPPPKHPKKDGQ